jgi:hypothetical protein
MMSLSKRIQDAIETRDVIRRKEVPPTFTEKYMLFRPHPAAPDAPGLPPDKGIRNLRKRERQKRAGKR